VIIDVLTPALIIGERNWFVEARDSNGQQLGWAEDPQGISIHPMPDANVVYSGIVEVSGLMVFRFTTEVKVPAGGRLQIGYPRMYAISCYGTSLEKVSLEGNVQCENYPQLGYFDLRMPRPLPPGQHAFAVMSIPCACPIAPLTVLVDVGACPPVRPACPQLTEANAFSIKVYDSYGEVSDAAMNVDGRTVQRPFRLRSMPLIWSNSEARRPATVTLGFELLEELPLEGSPVMSEVVVEVPPWFEQLINRTSDFQGWSSTVLGDIPPPLGLPLMRGSSWLDYSSHTRVRVHLNEQETQVLPVGWYRFSFPVMVPARMPAYNIWLLTVCGPVTPEHTAPCSGSDDPRSLVTFPLRGFDLGQTHPLGSQGGASGEAQRRFTGPGGVWCGLLLPIALLLTSPARRVEDDVFDTTCISE
jgi:hypothetical protein